MRTENSSMADDGAGSFIARNGHEISSDLEENKKIQDEDFKRSVIPFLKNSSEVKNFSAVTACYHDF